MHGVYANGCSAVNTFVLTPGGVAEYSAGSMAGRGFFGPSDRALEFGEQYSQVLAHWGEMFAAASALVESNVALGRMTSEAGKEFEEMVRGTAAAPWAWLDPDMLQNFMKAFSPGAGGRSE